MTMHLAAALEKVIGVGKVGTTMEPQLHLGAAGNERAHQARVPLPTAVREEPCRGVDHLVRLWQRPKRGENQRARLPGELLNRGWIRGEEAINRRVWCGHAVPVTCPVPDEDSPTVSMPNWTVSEAGQRAPHLGEDDVRSPLARSRAPTVWGDTRGTVTPMARRLTFRPRRD